MDNSRLVSPRALLVFVLATALSIGGFFLVRNGTERQDRALLDSASAQVELLLQSSVQNLQQQLRSVSFFTSSSRDTAQVFAQQVKSLSGGSGSSIALVDSAAVPPHVVVAQGTDLSPRQPLPASLAGFAARAGLALSATIVHRGATSLLALAASSTAYPHAVCLALSVLHPNVPTPNTSKAYSHIYVNVYASPKPEPALLIASTLGPGPLPSPVASAVLRFGSLHWLVQASQKSPLSGPYAEATPWIALGVGMAVALALAFIFEVLARRQRHAEALVAERTAALFGAQQDLVRSERLAALGEFAAVVGHELRNPLGAAVNELFLMRQRLQGALDPESETHVARAEAQIYRAAKLSGDLTSYTRDREPVLAEVDFTALVSEVLDTTPPPQGVAVSVEGAARFEADASLMAQVITNLVTNAYQAMPGGGALRLEAEEVRDGARITVQDSGDGFDPVVGDRLFDPFFSSKDEGTGLGLAIVHRLVTLHGGAVAIENAPAGGARVVIDLPRRPLPAP